MEIELPIVEKTKAHFRKYKTWYCCAGAGLLGAGITLVIMKGRSAWVGNAASDEDLILNKLFARSFNFFSHHNNVTSNIVTVVERDGRGHPGYIVRCLETNEIFPSQHAASASLGIPATVISDHLRGKFEDANGLHLERILVA
jgi:hypothetical protein